MDTTNHEDKHAMSGDNPIRERIKKRNPADFSSSSLRRIALTQVGRKQ
ncbi:hypothetical protein [Ferdinandcohnia sp. Marseille-Q9671]